MLWRRTRIIMLGMIVVAVSLRFSQSAAAAPPQPFRGADFVEVAPQGLGDPYNSATWSMQWWRGKLYVGTVRAWYCWPMAWAHMNISRLVPYPPAGKLCTPDPRDLPLQAEIWRYTPETETWDRVYQSPNNVEIPGYPGRYTSRDAGYRDMIVFTEPDGTEVLYAVGATVNAIWDGMPPPRILRSTDGETWEPVPQDPGTLLGDLGEGHATFRDMELYKGRLYVINGDIQGHGPVLEAENPAGGNDSFRWITPPGMRVFEMAPYNGYLYVGVVDRYQGYAIMKTDATGEPPYTFTPVVTNGAFLQPMPSDSAVTMHIFDGRLYVGTDTPTEVIRINPDDTWDLVMGDPRETPDGWKYPLSGLGTGFDWLLNIHIWRMSDYDGVLYIGTQDTVTDLSAALSRVIEGIDDLLGWQYGFDLYGSTDGYYFTPITVSGFGDKFQVGVRSLVPTPDGLYLGSVNYWGGMRIWRAVPRTENAVALAPPSRLEVENQAGGVVLSWDRPAGATRFHVFRSTPATHRRVRIRHLSRKAWLQGPYEEVGVTDGFFFVDTAVRPDRPYLYYVVAEDAAGMLSRPSNFARAPALAPAVTFGSLRAALDDWLRRDTDVLQGALPEAVAVLNEVGESASAKDLSHALRHLQELSLQVRRGQVALSEPWRAEDLEILLAKLARRVRLAQAGVIAPVDLN